MGSKEKLPLSEARLIIEEAKDAFYEVLNNRGIEVDPDDLVQDWLTAAAWRILQKKFKINTNYDKKTRS